MKRLKTFFIYALILVGFYFFSNILIFLSVKGSYKNIDGKIITLMPNVEIKEAKATYINGYLDGSVTNNANEKIENKYIKIDIFSERDVKLGTKYVKIENLDVNQTQEFHMGYRFTDSYRFEISCVDNVEGAVDEEFISEDLTGYLLLAGLLTLCFI